MNGDVWQLETADEQYACDLLNALYTSALRGNTKARNIIKKCFDGDNWKTIKARMDTEGSTWYVWYMDGIRVLLSQLA